MLRGEVSYQATQQVSNKRQMCRSDKATAACGQTPVSTNEICRDVEYVSEEVGDEAVERMGWKTR